MSEEDPTPRFLLGTLAAVATLLGATVISEAALGATPVGPEFQVNTYTTSLSRAFSLRRSVTSVEVASRWVSPSKRFLPASRNSLLHL